MTDQLLVIMENIPPHEWTPRLTEAWELRQDFHDRTCHWDARRDGDSQPGPAPKPAPVTFRRQMENCGFVFDVPGKSVEYRPTKAKGNDK
jgi:hypothetical protein